MPFMLYDVATINGANQYTLLRTIPIAGNTGPLAAIQHLKNPSADSPFRWHATSSEIVAALSGTSPTQEIIIDLKPNIAKNVSLFRLLDIWGFSYPDWTPLAVRLEALFGDLIHDDPKQFKACFSDATADHSMVGEFLYVQGGTAGGSWSWGRVGSVNGALLWRDAFDYLSGKLNEAL